MEMTKTQIINEIFESQCKLDTMKQIVGILFDIVSDDLKTDSDKLLFAGQQEKIRALTSVLMDGIYDAHSILEKIQDVEITE